VNSFNLDYVDVYNLILDRGYLGALDYANQIEGKNFRLASEIDKIVSELYVIASRPFNVRYAQTKINELPDLGTYSYPDSGTNHPQNSQQNNPYDYAGGDSSAKNSSEAARPREVGQPSSVLYSAGYIGSLLSKINFAVKSRLLPQTTGDIISNLLLKKHLSTAEIGRLSDLINAGLRNPSEFTHVHDFLGGIQRNLGNQGLRGVGWLRNLNKNVALEKSGLIIGILEAIARKFPWLIRASEFILRNSKFLAALAIPFDAYDIYTDYKREGLSNRVICKIVSIILGLASLFPAFTPIAAPLWLVSSVGCGLFFSQSNKSDEEYKNLTQPEIDKAEPTVTLESLPKRDQDLVNDLFESPDKKSLINKLRNLRDSKQFEKPIQSIALIQKELASWQPKIVPTG
jgi:hypothetical protein